MTHIHHYIIKDMIGRCSCGATKDYRGLQTKANIIASPSLRHKTLKIPPVYRSQYKAHYVDENILNGGTV